MQRYLCKRFQRVVLNGQTSSWRPILTSVPRGSMLEPLLFLVCINDIPGGLKNNVKLFADDTSIFGIVKNKNDSAEDFTYDSH